MKIFKEIENNGELKGFVYNRETERLGLVEITIEEFEDICNKKNKNIKIELLNTPYHTTKMQQEGIYDDFITYMDDQHEYEQLQRELEEKRKEAYQLALAENAELTYEEWLSGQSQLMPFAEPQPSQALLDFKKKYLG